MMVSLDCQLLGINNNCGDALLVTSVSQFYVELAEVGTLNLNLCSTMSSAVVTN